MPQTDAPEQSPIDRALGIAPNPLDAPARQQAAALARQLQQLHLPSGHLTGWSSLCAAEYREAVERLRRTVALAVSALDVARGSTL